MVTLRLLSLSTFLGVLASPAFAAKPKAKPAANGPDIGMLFNSLDKNNDGKVSLAEFQAFNGLPKANPAKAKKKATATLLINAGAKAKKAANAKKPSKAAKKAANAKKPATKANNNAPARTVSATQRNEWFKQLDTNRDGFLSLDEFSKVKELQGVAPATAKAAK